MKPSPSNPLKKGFAPLWCKPNYCAFSKWILGHSKPSRGGTASSGQRRNQCKPQRPKSNTVQWTAIHREHRFSAFSPTPASHRTCNAVHTNNHHALMAIRNNTKMTIHLRNRSDQSKGMGTKSFLSSTIDNNGARQADTKRKDVYGSSTSSFNGNLIQFTRPNVKTQNPAPAQMALNIQTYSAHAPP